MSERAQMAAIRSLLRKHGVGMEQLPQINEKFDGRVGAFMVELAHILRAGRIES